MSYMREVKRYFQCNRCGARRYLYGNQSTQRVWKQLEEDFGWIRYNEMHICNVCLPAHAQELIDLHLAGGKTE